MKLMNWQEMIGELLWLVAASDDSTTPEIQDWALGQFSRIGEFLDSLPQDQQLLLPKPQEFFKVKRQLLDAV